MNKTVNQSVSLPIELAEQLKQIAKEQERPLSWIITKLIQKGLDNEKKRIR